VACPEVGVSQRKQTVFRSEALRAGLVSAFPAGANGSVYQTNISLDTSLLAGTYEPRAVRPSLPDCPPGPAEAAAFGGAVLNLRHSLRKRATASA